MIIAPNDNEPKVDRAADARFLETFRKALRELGVGTRARDAKDPQAERNGPEKDAPETVDRRTEPKTPPRR